MADLRISELAALAGANLAAGDLLPIADVSASETKKITVTDLVGRATTLIADATIPSAKILFGANTIPGSSLTSSSVTATQLADDSVTAAKLADESSVDLVTTLPASGAFVGQIALDTDDSKIYCWNGSTWVTIKAAGSVNTVVGGTTGVVNVSVTASGDQVTINTTLDNTTQAAQFLAGPTAAAGTVGYRTIAGADLPTATTTTKGAVVVNGNGLTLSGDTIAINNSVTAQTSNFHVVQYDSKGLVTSGRLLTSSDVPLATASTVGVTKPGTGLNVTGAGTVNHTNAVAAGSGTKVSFDTEGHVTGTAALVESDIPDLSATKITTGTLDIGRIGTNAVIGSKLANFSVSKIGSTTPTAEHIGQFFFNPISRELSLWDGNVYQPVGISAGEIVFAGTYNAATNLLTSVTAEGVTAGFTNNAVLPAASALNNRHYVVVDNTGTGVSPAPAVALQPPDLLLSNGTSYRLIDVSQTVTAQTASTIVFTATGNITANDVQSAIVEVDSEKLAKAGDTLTGQLLISNTGSLVFEGATDNAFETTLGVVDPTADRTINLPNVSGTVVTTGDTGSVTSTMILDGTILNADVNASAAIAGTKISPDFGSQNVVTTGTSTAASFIPTSSTAPANGLYLPAANTVSISTASTERFRVDANGQLHAVSLGTAAAPTFSFVSDTNTGIYSPGADQLAISTGGAGRVFVNSAGAVSIVQGIGTSFARSLDVGGLNASISLRGLSSGTYTEQGIFFVVDGTTYSQIYNDGIGQLIFRTGSGLGERLRITSAGNVGIGTASPTQLLDVVGNADASVGSRIRNDSTGSSAQSVLILSAAGRDVSYVVNYSGQFASETGSNITSKFTNFNTHIWRSNAGTERARLDSSGRLLVGTSSVRVVGGGFQTSQTSGLYIEQDSNNITPFTVVANRNDGFGPRLFIAKTRGTAPGSVTTVTSGDEIGQVNFAAADGTSVIEAAKISAFVDGTPGTNDMPGRLVFSTTADGASSPTERLRITSAGFVGIGTSAPVDVLHINGGQIRIQRDVPQILFRSADGSSNQYYIGANISDTVDGGFVIGEGPGITGGTPRIAITGTGNVGIGTAGPVARLHVSQGADSNIIQYIQGASNGIRLGTNTNAALIDGVDATNGSTSYQPLFLNGSDLRLGSGGAERARIDTNGRLLVGTSSAVSSSSGVLGALQHQSSDTGTLANANFGRWTNDTGGYALYFAKSRGTSVGTQGLVSDGDFLGALFFEGSDGTQLRRAASITANVDGTPGANDMPGRLVFSTTADGASTPTERLRIKNNGDLQLFQSSTSTPGLGNTTTGIGIESSTGAVFISRASESGNLWLNSNAAAGTATAVSFMRSGTAVGTISTTTTATAYNTSSDYRLKENVVAVTDGITRLQQLKPSRFNFIADPAKTVDGFIAHEVQTVVPEAITGEKDAVDDDGNPIYQGIDQSKLVPLLTAALQEAVAKIESLEARLTAAGI